MRARAASGTAHPTHATGSQVGGVQQAHGEDAARAAHTSGTALQGERASCTGVHITDTYAWLSMYVILFPMNTHPPYAHTTGIHGQGVQQQRAGASHPTYTYQ